MSIAETRFAGIDFEGAGSAPGRSDEPVQIAVVHLLDGEITDGLSTYVCANNPVTWAARKVHGITDDMIANAPSLTELWPEVRDNMTGCWIVAHGAATEKRFLRAFPFHGFGPWVDTLSLARAVFPSLPSHSLGAVIESLGLQGQPEICCEGFRWHDARSDAIASLVLLRHIIATCNLRHADPQILQHRKA